MNILGRDIHKDELVVTDDDTVFRVTGGDGMNQAFQDRGVIYGVAVDPDSHDQLGEKCRIEADICQIRTATFQAGSRTGGLA